MTLRRRTTVLAAALAATLLGAGGVAGAATHAPAITTTTPRSANDITNIDVLRQQIANYYGDPLETGVVGPDSNYTHEVADVEVQLGAWLGSPRPAHGTKAVVFDVDDTTLETWNYEAASNWDYNPTTNAAYVTGQKFPAVPGMLTVASEAARHGYAVFFITGRPAAQEAATLGNLTADGIGVDAGYPAPTRLVDSEDGLFTKPAVADYPDYLKAACAADPAATCTTIHFKAATRAHIESLGYDIIANVGDQYSDLAGGSADRGFKVPNPNYYLP